MSVELINVPYSENPLWTSTPLVYYHSWENIWPKYSLLLCDTEHNSTKVCCSFLGHGYLLSSHYKYTQTVISFMVSNWAWISSVDLPPFLISNFRNNFSPSIFNRISIPKAIQLGKFKIVYDSNSFSIMYSWDLRSYVMTKWRDSLQLSLELDDSNEVS